MWTASKGRWGVSVSRAVACLDSWALLGVSITCPCGEDMPVEGQSAERCAKRQLSEAKKKNQ